MKERDEIKRTKSKGLLLTMSHATLRNLGEENERKEEIE